MYRCAIGIDLGGTNVRMGFVGPDGVIHVSSRMRTEVHEGPARVVSRLVSGIEALSKKAASRGLQPAGVGIGVPGIISAGAGIVRFSPNLTGWKDVPLGDLLEDRLGLRVKVENDANAYALGEYRFGAGRGAGSLVCITLGTGVGGGIIIGGRLVRGTDGMAGEVGHMTVRPNGIRCRCGNRGCVERYSSATAIVERTLHALAGGADSSLLNLYRKDPGFITAHAVYEAAKAGDGPALKVYRDAGVVLGILAANLVNLLNIERVVVGGGMSGAWDLLSGPISAEVGKRAFKIPASSCCIVKGALGDDAAVLGAAGLVLSGKKGDR